MRAKWIAERSPRVREFDSGDFDVPIFIRMTLFHILACCDYRIFRLLRPRIRIRFPEIFFCFAARQSKNDLDFPSSRVTICAAIDPGFLAKEGVGTLI